MKIMGREGGGSPPPDPILEGGQHDQEKRTIKEYS